MLVIPDMPVLAEHEVKNGLWAPERVRAERFNQSSDGFLAYEKGDIQIVSGTVVTAPSKIQRHVKATAATAALLGGQAEPAGDGTVSLSLTYDGPVPGDRVFFGYGTWGKAEASKDVFMDEDTLMGKIDVNDIDLIFHDGEWRCAGPWAVLEPVPSPVPDKDEFTAIGTVDMVPFLGYMRLQPPEKHMVAPPIDTVVLFNASGRPVFANPFSESGWYKVKVDDLCEVVGDAPAREEIDLLWKRLHDHNAEIARFKPIPDISTQAEYDRNYKAEIQEITMKQVRKRYKTTQLWNMKN